MEKTSKVSVMEANKTRDKTKIKDMYTVHYAAGLARMVLQWCVHCHKIGNGY